MRARLLALSTTALLLAPHPATGEEKAAARAPWLDNLSLVVLDSDDVASLHAAHASIRAQGGSVAILSPPNLLLGWIPTERRPALLGQAHIRAIHREAVDPLGFPEGQSRAMVTYFNAAVRGSLQPPAQVDQPAAWPPGASDAVAREPLETWAYLENLQANGFDPEQLAQRHLLLGKTTPDATIQGNSDRMTGTVTVTLLFVESDGSGADPDSYTWTDADVQSYVNGVNTGLAWWSARARDYNDCWVAFFVRYVPPTDARCQQWREMVLHSQGDVASMASEIMSNFGFNAGSHIARTDAFNTAQRATYGTDWAYTAYVAYNPLPAPDRLTNGTSAFAYLTGPYTFLLFRSYGWLPEQVFTHESGHIFGACDEYADACSCGAICIDEPNGNCEDCGTSVSCMMRANTFTLCTYTDNQLGWHDTTPCASPPLLPPTAISIEPSTAAQGTQVQATITGQDFLYGAFADLGNGVQILTTNLVDPNTLELTLQIDNAATPGSRNVTVSNRDLQSSTLTGAFQVTATTRHYYDTAGSNQFPYHTPATAATSLSAAISAAAAGDSVLVASGTLPLGSLVLSKAVLLSGGWVDGFTARDLDQGKTVFNLIGNVLIAVSGSGTGGLDGFVLRGGAGTPSSVPFTGHYGGGVFIISSSGLIANCDIDSNQATPSSDFGGGGGIFATNSIVTLRHNTFRKNRATWGGGLYLHDSSGLVENNHFIDNEVSPSTQTPRGAAIVIDQCDGVSLVDNVLEQNGGAERGGGLSVLASTQVSVQGGRIDGHQVSNSGGGAHLEGSDVALRNVVFERNGSDFSEGGVAAQACSLDIEDCRFLWNTAILYGAIRSTGPHTAVRHNLFVGNEALLTGGLSLGSLVSGEVTGNTFDRNVASNSGGCLALADSPIQVSNNIVANTTGTGISCSGTLPSLVAYNLVWNSSVADYAGCTPGAGSLGGEPLFADTSQVDYHLAVHSPAIDAGRPDSGYADPDGSPGDLGLYGSHPFIMDQPVFPKNLRAVTESGNVVLHWSSNPEGDLSMYAVYCDSVSGFKPGLENFVAFVASPDTTTDLGPPGACLWFTLAAVDSAGYASGYAAEAELEEPTDAFVVSLPTLFRLHPSVPNPFNPVTTIRFDLDRPGAVRLGVYDLTGRLVRVLVQESLEAGPHGVVWDGRDRRGRPVPSGVYLLRLQSAGRLRAGKVTVLK